MPNALPPSHPQRRPGVFSPPPAEPAPVERTLWYHSKTAWTALAILVVTIGGSIGGLDEGTIAKIDAALGALAAFFLRDAIEPGGLALRAKKGGA
ncbi:MAG TPA: hypothetical protein VEA41_21250 [Salinarimonas sp.]|nr:hypothetical protein [Salinarimonas sp.]